MYKGSDGCQRSLQMVGVGRKKDDRARRMRKEDKGDKGIT